ncbi:MAG: hypothetical protein JWO58_2312 [Chitinophagaceae bacterium]|nr:hypothetical protein [Chitinophagaceae bacterium]
MKNLPEVILLSSILIIALYYLSSAEHKLIKLSILSFIFVPLPGLLKQFFSMPYPLGFLSIAGLFISVVLVLIHVAKSEVLQKKDVLLIRVFLIPLLLSCLSIAFHPISFIGVCFIPVSIGILFYFTFKYQNKEYMTDELRILNLMGIQLFLQIVRAMMKLSA